MKKFILATIAIGAHILAEAASPNLDNLTTNDLESSTKEFIKSLGERETDNTGRRVQRTSSTRQQRLGGKSGKAKGGESGWQELYYILPASCPNQCISSNVNAQRELEKSLMMCNQRDDSQCWSVLSDGSYIMVESYVHMGKCISVDYERGDSPEDLNDACEDGVLMLKDCDADFGTEWYFTGGQLVSSLCWAAGISTLMTIFVNQSDDDTTGDGLCDSQVAAWGDPDDAILRADTFLFVSRIPRLPFNEENPFIPSTSPTMQ